MLTKMYRQSNARVQSLRFSSNQNEANWKLAVKEHERIIMALEDQQRVAWLLFTAV